MEAFISILILLFLALSISGVAIFGIGAVIFFIDREYSSFGFLFGIMAVFVYSTFLLFNSFIDYVVGKDKTYTAEELIEMKVARKVVDENGNVKYEVIINDEQKYLKTKKGDNYE